MMHSRVWGVWTAILCCLAVCWAGAAYAAPSPHDAAKALYAWRTAKIAFTQYAPDGSVSHGTLWVARPNRVRWEYRTPHPLLLVVNGTLAAQYDPELDSLATVPVRDTLMSVVSQDPFRFDAPNLTVVDALRADPDTPGMWRTTLQQARAPEEGRVTLVFAPEGSGIRWAGFVAIDGAGQQTRIVFDRVVPNPTIPPDMFSTAASVMRRYRTTASEHAP